MGWWGFGLVDRVERDGVVSCMYLLFIAVWECYAVKSSLPSSSDCSTWMLRLIHSEWLSVANASMCRCIYMLNWTACFCGTKSYHTQSIHTIIFH